MSSTDNVVVVRFSLVDGERRHPYVYGRYSTPAKAERATSSFQNRMRKVMGEDRIREFEIVRMSVQDARDLGATVPDYITA